MLEQNNFEIVKWFLKRIIFLDLNNNFRILLCKLSIEGTKHRNSFQIFTKFSQ